MKLFKIFFFLVFAITFEFFPQTDSTQYYPLEVGTVWEYPHHYNSIMELISDDVVFDDKTYHILSIQDGATHHYLRTDTSNIYLFIPEDSTEYLLFSFDSGAGKSWTIDSGNDETACYWGTEITVAGINDTVITPWDIFENCIHFQHYSPCADAGLTDTWFAPGIGKVKFIKESFAGLLNYSLLSIPADTTIITGRYQIVGNPCLTDPCPPGVVSAVVSGGTEYIFTLYGVWFDDDFAWGDYIPELGDSINVSGVVREHTDIFGDEYITLEILDMFKVNPISVDEESNLQNEFKLYQNYPNPFNPVTTITFDIPAGRTGRANAEHVTLRIFDLLGREVKTLIDKPIAPGKYKVEFNPENLASGIYYYTISMNEKSLTKKLILIK